MMLLWLQENPEQNYWLCDFAAMRGYSRQRFSEWAKDPAHYEFSDAYQRAKEIQESRLFKIGLGLKNQTLICLALKANHGWAYPTGPQVVVNSNGDGKVDVDIHVLSDDEIQARLVAAVAERERREREQTEKPKRTRKGGPA